MRLFVLGSIALALSMIGLIAFFVASPVSDVPTGEAGIQTSAAASNATESPTPKLSVECNVSGGTSPGETATKVCLIQKGDFCKLVTLTWTERQGDQTFNSWREWFSLRISFDACRRV